MIGHQLLSNWSGVCSGRRMVGHATVLEVCEVWSGHSVGVVGWLELSGEERCQ